MPIILTPGQAWTAEKQCTVIVSKGSIYIRFKEKGKDDKLVQAGSECKLEEGDQLCATEEGSTFEA
jgi:hypothetical protein